MRSATTDWTSTLDAVQAMDDVGDGPVGWWGLSMGTGLGVPFVAREPRIQVAVFGLGAAWVSRPSGSSSSPARSRSRSCTSFSSRTTSSRAKVASRCSTRSQALTSGCMRTPELTAPSPSKRSTRPRRSSPSTWFPLGLACKTGAGQAPRSQGAGDAAGDHRVRLFVDRRCHGDLGPHTRSRDVYRVARPRHGTVVAERAGAEGTRLVGEAFEPRHRRPRPGRTRDPRCVAERQALRVALREREAHQGVGHRFSDRHLHRLVPGGRRSVRRRVSRGARGGRERVPSARTPVCTSSTATAESTGTGRRRATRRASSAPRSSTTSASSRRPRSATSTATSKPDVVYGSFNQKIYAKNRKGADLPGWPRENFDTIWSSAALARPQRGRAPRDRPRHGPRWWRGGVRVREGRHPRDAVRLQRRRAYYPNFPRCMDTPIWSTPAVAGRQRRPRARHRRRDEQLPRGRQAGRHREPRPGVEHRPGEKIWETRLPSGAPRLRVAGRSATSGSTATLDVAVGTINAKNYGEMYLLDAKTGEDPVAPRGRTSRRSARASSWARR